MQNETLNKSKNEGNNSTGQWALSNFLQPKDKVSPDNLLPPLDNDHTPNPEDIAEAADLAFGDSDDILSHIFQAPLDKLPQIEPLEEIKSGGTPSPPKLEPNKAVKTEKSENKGFDAPDNGYKLSFTVDRDSPIPLHNNKSEQVKSGAIKSSSKSPVSGNVKSATSAKPGTSPRRGRPPKNKPKEEPPELVKAEVHANMDSTASKKSVSRQKSETKSKTSRPEKKTETSAGKPGRGRPPKSPGRPKKNVKKSKSREFIPSSESSSESSGSDSGSESSSDEETFVKSPQKPEKSGQTKPAKIVKASPRNSATATKSPPSNKETPAKAKYSSPRKADYKPMPVVSKKVKEESPSRTPASMDSTMEVDLEDILNSVSSDVQDTPLSPLPRSSTDTPPSSKPTNHQTAVSPMLESTAVFHSSRNPTGGSPNVVKPSLSTTSTVNPNKTSPHKGLTYVDGRPCVMVRINLSKIDKWPLKSKMQADSLTEESAEDNSDLSAIHITPVHPVLGPLPPSPAAHGLPNSDSISTSSEFSDGEIRDDSEEEEDKESDKSASEDECNVDNVKDTEQVKDTNDAEDANSSSDEDENDDEGQDANKEDKTERESVEIKSEEAPSPAPVSIVTAADQKNIYNEILKADGKPSLSSVRIPKKRPQSSPYREDLKRARTDHYDDFANRQ